MKRSALAVIAPFLLLLCARDGSAQQPDILRVIRIQSETPSSFELGTSCVFETTLPKIPLRLRMIRGKKEQLIRYGRDPYNSRGGCVEYYSILVRPERDGEFLDLGFDLQEGWLNGRSNGYFVIVAELDDRPRGPKVELDPLRLVAGTTTSYFQWAIEMTVLAPEYIAVPAPKSIANAADQRLTRKCAVVNIDPRPPAVFQAEGAAVMQAVTASGVD